MAYARGDVVLVPFPFAEISATKARPAIVLNDPSYKRSTGNLILAQITGRGVRFPSDYALRDWAKAGLKRPSVVRMKLATMAAELVRFRVGRVSAQDAQAVAGRLRHVLGL